MSTGSIGQQIINGTYGLDNRPPTAFEELKQQGYLIPKDKSKVKETVFIFYDKSQLEVEQEEIIIEIPKQKVEELQRVSKAIDSCGGKDGFIF